jgi:hypothetical protein
MNSFDAAMLSERKNLDLARQILFDSIRESIPLQRQAEDCIRAIEELLNAEIAYAIATRKP